MHLFELDEALVEPKKNVETHPSHLDVWGSQQDHILSSITHDLRAPLCAIMGYLDLVGRQVEKSSISKAVEYLSLARQAGQRMHQMVNDMLDMFRFENGSSFLQRKKIPVTKLFHNVETTFAGLARVKKVHLHTQVLDKSPLSVWADARFLGRALDNLVANAIKFTPAGGSIQVLARRSGGRTIIEVTDTGRGIPAADRKRIFEKFQHVRATDCRQGFGMGLAVVKAIVDAHQGHVRVVSKLGKGSRFILGIPNAPISLTYVPSTSPN